MRERLAENKSRVAMTAEAAISLALLVLIAMTLSVESHAQGPVLTTINGTVYRADGTAAEGTVLITWPSFQTATGEAVTAGNLAVTIGPLGAFTAQLAPTVGASPAGTCYVAVFQLDDGTVRTEYWAVPATSPTTIAGVLTTPGTGLGNLVATQQYVNAAVAAAVLNVGAGTFLPLAGGTMTGPLTLPADPVAPNQATDQHYVDNGLLAKANLVSGMVPPGELGSGTASSATCLLGNSTWGSCGSGSGGGNVSSVFGRTGAVVAASGDYTASQVTGAAVDAAVVHLANTETINGAKTFTNNVTASGNLVLPQASGLAPAVGGIGIDTAAGLPVVNIGGTLEQVALTSSNISGQAGTALALAAVPTQCTGSFATGIAENGNANCSTADVIQLEETAQPAGIPNWGVFWFDAATHSPRVIENNGQVMQLGLTNLFNSDPGGDPADNIEERNGSNAENLRVYSSYTNDTTWQRTSLGFDAADNPPVGYAVIRSENATSASAPGLGFWIGSSLKWVVDPTGTLKPWAQPGVGDNQFSIGSDTGNAVKSVFAETSFNSMVYGRSDIEVPNDGSTGTAVDRLAVFNGHSPSQAVLAGTSATNGVIGLVQGGAGATGNAVVTWNGYAYCIFDNPTTAGDAVIASTITAGDCHDTGSAEQPVVQLIGYVDVTNTSSGLTNGMRISLQAPAGGSGGGSVSSVFGRTGAVTAASGDYSVSQVTGAAVDSAVVHLAGSETITGAKTFSSTMTLNGNLNVAGNINQTGSGPTQWSGQEWTGTTVTVPSGMGFSLGVGSDNTFHCQLANGSSCMPSGGGSMVYPGAGIPSSTGSAWGTSYGTSGSGTTLALTASPVFTGSPTVPGYVPTGTTVNGHALTSNVTLSASDLTTGTLPHAELPALVSGDIPNNAANTSGTAANLSGTPALPGGTTASTQSAGDNSTKLATTAYVKNEIDLNWTCPVAGSTSVSQNCNWTLPAGLTVIGFDFAANTAPIGCTTYPVVQLWDGTASAEVGSYSTALSSGTNFYTQATGSANVASGHLLRVKVTTAASGCSTNAAGMVATVTYQMQN